MPDDGRLQRYFDEFYRDSERRAADKAMLDCEAVDKVAAWFLAAIEDATIRNPDFDEAYKSAAETMRNCWHDAKADLQGSIKRGG